ncbi:MAG TPA: hypothetical protein VGV85_13120, partial [Longimicrobiaceae bacterium]|nr:hypothetical protein [Longimicrobiaceae bacterium]
MPHPSDSTLFARAAAIVRAGPRVAELWPPYWAADRAFMLTRKADQAMLLVSPTPPGDGFAPLAGGDVPRVLRGRAYIRYGFPEELAMSGGFTTAFPVAGTTVPSLPLDFSRDHFYFLAGHFHEAFHAYQGRRFNEAAGVKSGFGRPVATSPRTGTAEFEARAEIERRILAAALRTTSADSLRPLLLGYLAVRHARSWGAPDVQQVERAMEL